MAITDINISEQLQTDAPSIKYTGNEGPQASPQHQQEQMIAQQIWEALSPEQQGQFQSFEQFFQSGVWKQILQQMQQDEGQGPEQQQGIGSLGPEPMQQQMPAPNRMGAQYGGRMGYAGGEMVEKIKEKIIEGGDRAQGIPGVDESIWIEKLIEHLRKKRGERRDPREEFMPEWDRDPGFIRPTPDWERDPGFIRPPRPRRPRRPREEIEIEGIETLRGRP